MRRLRLVASITLAFIAIMAVAAWVDSLGRPHDFEPGPAGFRSTLFTVNDGALAWIPSDGSGEFVVFGLWRALAAALLGLAWVVRPRVVHDLANAECVILLAIVLHGVGYAGRNPGCLPATWLFDAVGAVVAVRGLWRGAARALHHGRLPKPGYCRCGYDLRATPERCPECRATAFTAA